MSHMATPGGGYRQVVEIFRKIKQYGYIMFKNLKLRWTQILYYLISDVLYGDMTVSLKYEKLNMNSRNSSFNTSFGFATTGAVDIQTSQDIYYSKCVNLSH